MTNLCLLPAPNTALINFSGTLNIPKDTGMNDGGLIGRTPGTMKPFLVAISCLQQGRNIIKKLLTVYFLEGMENPRKLLLNFRLGAQ